MTDVDRPWSLPTSTSLKSNRRERWVTRVRSRIVSSLSRGVGFFFGINGVFGLSVSLASLATFIAVAVWTFNSKQLPDAGR
jgi:hypothetical protein